MAKNIRKISRMGYSYVMTLPLTWVQDYKKVWVKEVYDAGLRRAFLKLIPLEENEEFNPQTGEIERNYREEPAQQS